MASDICYYVLFRLQEEFSCKASLGYKALVSCVPGDSHEMGAEIMESYLEMKGWEALSMGHVAPHQDILQATLAMRPDAVFFSVSMIARLPAALDSVREIRSLLPEVKIIMGGRAAFLAGELIDGEVDAVVSSFEEGHARALELVRSHA